MRMDDALDRRLRSLLAEADAPFDAALAAVLVALGAQIGTLHRLEADEHLHLVAATPGLPEPVLAASRRIPLGKGIAGEAAATRQPVSLCNLQTDTSGVARPGAKTTGLGGSLCVPILEGDAVIGTLGVGWVGARDVSDADTATLLAAAAALAPALRR
jgi:L-methionine (R)-S-oxide reductase